MNPTISSALHGIAVAASTARDVIAAVPEFAQKHPQVAQFCDGFSAAANTMASRIKDTANGIAVGFARQRHGPDLGHNQRAQPADPNLPQPQPGPVVDAPGARIEEKLPQVVPGDGTQVQVIPPGPGPIPVVPPGAAPPVAMPPDAVPNVPAPEEAPIDVVSWFEHSISLGLRWIWRTTTQSAKYVFCTFILGIWSAITGMANFVDTTTRLGASMRSYIRRTAINLKYHIQSYVAALLVRAILGIGSLAVRSLGRVIHRSVTHMLRGVAATVQVDPQAPNISSSPHRRSLDALPYGTTLLYWDGIALISPSIEEKACQYVVGWKQDALTPMEIMKSDDRPCLVRISRGRNGIAALTHSSTGCIPVGLEWLRGGLKGGGYLNTIHRKEKSIKKPVCHYAYTLPSLPSVCVSPDEQTVDKVRIGDGHTHFIMPRDGRANQEAIPIEYRPARCLFESPIGPDAIENPFPCNCLGCKIHATEQRIVRHLRREVKPVRPDELPFIQQIREHTKSMYPDMLANYVEAFHTLINKQTCERQEQLLRAMEKAGFNSPERMYMEISCSDLVENHNDVMDLHWKKEVNIQLERKGTSLTQTIKPTRAYFALRDLAYVAFMPMFAILDRALFAYFPKTLPLEHGAIRIYHMKGTNPMQKGEIFNEARAGYRYATMLDGKAFDVSSRAWLEAACSAYYMPSNFSSMLRLLNHAPASDKDLIINKNKAFAWNHSGMPNTSSINFLVNTMVLSQIAHGNCSAIIEGDDVTLFHNEDFWLDTSLKATHGIEYTIDVTDAHEATFCSGIFLNGRLEGKPVTIWTPYPCRALLKRSFCPNGNPVTQLYVDQVLMSTAVLLAPFPATRSILMSHVQDPERVLREPLNWWVSTLLGADTPLGYLDTIRTLKLDDCLLGRYDVTISELDRCFASIVANWAQPTGTVRHNPLFEQLYCYEEGGLHLTRQPFQLRPVVRRGGSITVAGKLLYTGHLGACTTVASLGYANGGNMIRDLRRKRPSRIHLPTGSIMINGRIEQLIQSVLETYKLDEVAALVATVWAMYAGLPY